MGKKFFCIGVTGGIYELEDADTKLDDELKEFGNYFTSRAEAEEALKRIKEVLNEHGRNKENS